VNDQSENPIDVADPFARQLVARYIERRKEDLERLTAALRDGDLELVRNTGHRLYGSGATYGLQEVSRLGRALEKAAESADTRRIAQIIEELGDFVRAVKIR
jgi:HPt (histidine-containing phosphotransfer) domain-containing protein